MIQTEFTVDNIYEKTKLRVVGWTDYDDDFFDDAELTDETLFVVARAVRDGKYLFGGESHQDECDCCPVLSNGKCARYSWRGWGLVIAIAYDIRGNNGDYDHLVGYMNQNINPEFFKTPECGVGIDYSKIEFETPPETFYFVLSDSQDIFAPRCYLAMPATAETDKVKPHDTIILSSNIFDAIREKHIVRKVFRAESFDEVLKLLEESKAYIFYDAFGYEKVGDKTGIAEDMSRDELLRKLQQDYPNAERVALFSLDLIGVISKN